MERGYLTFQTLTGALMLGIGVAMVIVTIARGGGIASIGIVFGVLLALLGAGRLWIARGVARGRAA